MKRFLKYWVIPTLLGISAIVHVLFRNMNSVENVCRRYDRKV